MSCQRPESTLMDNLRYEQASAEGATLYQPRLADRAAGRSKGLGRHAKQRRGLKARPIRYAAENGSGLQPCSHPAIYPGLWTGLRLGPPAWAGIASHLRCLIVRNGRLFLQMPFSARQLVRTALIRSRLSATRCFRSGLFCLQLVVSLRDCSVCNPLFPCGDCSVCNPLLPFGTVRL